MSELEITAFLLAHYPFQTIRLGERLATKGQRQALLLQTEQGPYVLKISEPGRSEMTVRSDTGILSYLEKHGYPAPRLLQTLDGRDYLPYGDCFLHLYAYLAGQHPLPSKSFMEKAGRMLAQLHNLPSEAYGRESSYTPRGIVEEVRGYFQRAQQTDQCTMAEDLLDRLDRLPSFDHLPRGLIHTDPYLVNWLEDPAGALTLIDWDDAGVGIPLLDVGYMVANLTTYPRHEAQRWGVEQTGQITWREDWGRAFLAAYQEIHPLTGMERALLPAAIQLSVLAYMWDWDRQCLTEDNMVRLEIVECFRL